MMEQRPTEAPPGHLNYLEQALLKFADNETKYTAGNVYEMFTEVNRFKDPDGKPLLSLMDTMRSYEERASTLTESQRDHFVHSVNVFMMGVQIYMFEPAYRDAFRRAHTDSTFDNMDECFLYTWGHTALFHDIGYPIEIAANQVKAFVKSISSIGVIKKDGKPRLADSSIYVSDFIRISNIPLRSWDNNHGVVDALELIGENISSNLGLDKSAVYDVLSTYNERMRDSRFVDHGYYSALILMRSMADSMQKAGLDEKRFMRELVEVSSAIILHNFYLRVFTNKEQYSFGCSPMSVHSHPLAYLLILCDELQDWNRRKYGSVTKTLVYPDNGRISFHNDVMTINYRTVNGNICDSFGSQKKLTLKRLLRIEDVFSDIRISCSCDESASLLISTIQSKTNEAFPRPILDNIEQIAKAIHQEYNSKRLIEQPDRPLEYPTWEGLPQDLKYSNITQALGISDRLALIHCHIGFPNEGQVVEDFTKEEIMIMARAEHDRWRAERESNGWIWGNEKDVEKRISPYIANWDAIPAEIQKYDVEAVENTIPLLKSIGLRVLRNDE